jgi:cytochrome P450
MSLFNRKQKLGQQLIAPLINERLEMKKDEMPQDMLSWLIQAAPSHELNVAELTRRVLTLNFAAIHTTSIVRFFITL